MTRNCCTDNRFTCYKTVVCFRTNNTESFKDKLLSQHTQKNAFQSNPSEVSFKNTHVLILRYVVERLDNIMPLYLYTVHKPNLSRSLSGSLALFLGHVAIKYYLLAVSFTFIMVNHPEPKQRIFKDSNYRKRKKFFGLLIFFQIIALLVVNETGSEEWR